MNNYYGFGLAMPGRSVNTANPNDDYKFTGHERDDEAGLTLDYMMARNYDPIIGRFLQIDPMLEYASPYTYVGNNPMNLTDPTGMFSCNDDAQEDCASQYGDYSEAKLDAMEAGTYSSEWEDGYSHSLGYSSTTNQGQALNAIDPNCPDCPEISSDNTDPFVIFKSQDGKEYVFVAGNWLLNDGKSGDNMVLGGTGYVRYFDKWIPIYVPPNDFLTDYAESYAFSFGTSYAATGLLTKVWKTSGWATVFSFTMGIGYEGMKDADKHYSKYLTPEERKILSMKAKEYVMEKRKGLPDPYK